MFKYQNQNFKWFQTVLSFDLLGFSKCGLKAEKRVMPILLKQQTSSKISFKEEILKFVKHSFVSKKSHWLKHFLLKVSLFLTNSFYT